MGLPPRLRLLVRLLTMLFATLRRMLGAGPFAGLLARLLDGLLAGLLARLLAGLLARLLAGLLAGLLARLLEGLLARFRDDGPGMLLLLLLLLVNARTSALAIRSMSSYASRNGDRCTMVLPCFVNATRRTRSQPKSWRVPLRSGCT
jgi:uncharacterized membrane protein YeaQ/YmgE (transglycosylase-associated protein family)